MQKMNRLTDEMLVKAYANGDNKAFAQTHEKFHVPYRRNTSR